MEIEVINEEFKIYKIKEFIFYFSDVVSINRQDDDYNKRYILLINFKGGQECSFIYYAWTVDDREEEKRKRDEVYNYLLNEFKNINKEKMKEINQIIFGQYPQRKIDIE